MPVNYPKFIGPAERIELDTAMKRIAMALTERRADFLFGAGMSVQPPSSVPAGRELAVKLLEEYLPDGVDDAKPEDAKCPTCGTKTGTQPRKFQLEGLATALPFECIAEAIENGPGRKRDDLTKYLRQLLLKPEFEINQAHHEFLTVFSWDGRARLRRVFTTNFDPLIERALGGCAVRVTERNANEIDTIQERKQVPVLHLHGVLDEEYQITESDVFGEGFKNLHLRLRTALDESDAFVFVGYSMSDPDFRRLYLKHRDDLKFRKERMKDAYVVSPAKDDYSYVLAKAVWKSRWVIFLPLDAESFFAGLKYFLDCSTRQDIQRAIMKKYGLTDERAFEDKVNTAADILQIDKTEATQFLFEARTKTGE